MAESQQKKRVSNSSLELTKIVMWLHEHHESLVGIEATLLEAARQIQEDLGVRVTPSRIHKLVQGFDWQDWPIKQNKARPTDRVRRVALCLREVCQSAGIPEPADLSQLVAGSALSCRPQVGRERQLDLDLVADDDSHDAYEEDYFDVSQV